MLLLCLVGLGMASALEIASERTPLIGENLAQAPWAWRFRGATILPGLVTFGIIVVSSGHQTDNDYGRGTGPWPGSARKND